MTTAVRQRILFICQEFTVGGAAALTLRHIQRLTVKFEIDFLVTGPCEKSMLDQLPDEVSLFRLSTSRLAQSPDVLGSLDPIGCLEMFLKRSSTEIFDRVYLAVLATSVFRDWRACIALSLVQASRKLVFLVDEGLIKYPRMSPRDKSAVNCCLLAADLALPVSMGLWQTMTLHCPALKRLPMQVLRPPVDIERSAFQTQDQSLEPSPVELSTEVPSVLTVARLVPDKQILESLRVHHRLREAGIKFRWYVIGRGPEEAMLRAEVRRLDMTKDFILMGEQDKLRILDLMTRCDIFALFSTSEGCPTVIIEALMCGSAVITTRVNGVTEMIDNGRTGLIVGNTAEAMDKGLSELVCNADLRNYFRNQLAADPPIADSNRETALLVNAIGETSSIGEIPRVSILIPTFNHERYIDQAIASALMQDFPSLEVVVADDASSDKTATLAKKWASDPRFTLIQRKHNVGRVANYRSLLNEHARGEWVLMLDGDDHLLDPGFIRHAYQSIQRQSGRNVVFAQAGHRVHFVNQQRDDSDILPKIAGAERLLQGSDYLQFVFETGFFTHLGALYHRASAIRNGFYTRDISSSDMDSLLRLALEGEVLILNTIAGCWVQHGENASSHVALEDIPANVRIFRQISAMAVKRGLISSSSINKPLTRYEGRTLAHLLSQSFANSESGPASVFKIFSIIVSINPFLLFSIRLPSVLLRAAMHHVYNGYFRKLRWFTPGT